MQSLRNEKIASLKSKGFLVFCAVTTVLTVCLYRLVVSLSADNMINTFDPFQILGIDRSASLKAIKQAYRALSKQKHPDQNRDNPAAAQAEFIVITRAYKTLIDEESNRNWKLYGNPDGRQTMEFNLGLPTFLIEASNKLVVLATYLVWMVGVVPYCVYFYYSKSSQYGNKGVKYDTYAWFHYNLSEHTMLRAVPEILAGSSEFRQRNAVLTLPERRIIQSQMNRIKSRMVKPKFNHPVCVKGNVLLHSHLLRKTDSLSTNQKEALLCAIGA